MLHVLEAKELIYKNVSSTKVKELALKETQGHALANDVFAPMDYPPFHQSAMDGYAIKFDKWCKSPSLKIISEVKAGDETLVDLSDENVAVRIFTGAKIPIGFDTVVVQEKVELKNGCLIIQDESLKRGANIRLQASQTKAHDLILEKGSALNPAMVSLLASVGIGRIKVHQMPKVVIINTGNELTIVGETLTEGKIFESNSICLEFALRKMNIEVSQIVSVTDDLESIKKTINQVENEAEIVILTGGVSVGDYDFVHQALVQNHATIVFHKVKQKPGKPILFAKKGDKVFFGLPGNPASVLICFYQYMLPAIRKMIGFADYELPHIYLPVENQIIKKAGLTHFLKAKLSSKGVVSLEHQESYKMNSFAIANAIIELDANIEKVEVGTLVKVYLLQS